MPLTFMRHPAGTIAPRTTSTKFVSPNLSAWSSSGRCGGDVRARAQPMQGVERRCKIALNLWCEHRTDKTFRESWRESSWRESWRESRQPCTAMTRLSALSIPRHTPPYPPPHFQAGWGEVRTPTMYAPTNPKRVITQQHPESNMIATTNPECVRVIARRQDGNAPTPAITAPGFVGVFTPT